MGTMNRHRISLYALCLVGCTGGRMNLGPDGTELDAGIGGAVSTGGTGALDAGGSTQNNGVPGTVAPIIEWQVQSLHENLCDGITAEVELFPSLLHVLVDASASMNQPVAGSAVNRWQSTKQSLLGAFDAIMNADPFSLTQASLRLLPLHNGAANPNVSCISSLPEVSPVWEAVPNSSFATVTGVLNATTPGGTTPLVDAYLAAQAEMSHEVASPTARSILLVTDGNGSLNAGCQSPCAGKPACATYSLDSTVDAEMAGSQPLLDAINAAYTNNNITTFVVGTQGSEANRSWLSQAAKLGRTAKEGCLDTNATTYCHIDLPAGDDLGKALSPRFNTSIFNEDCTIETAGTDWDPSQLTFLAYTSERVFQVTLDTLNTPTCSEGFRFANGSLRLCTDTCERFRHEAIGMWELLLSCAE